MYHLLVCGERSCASLHVFCRSCLMQRMQVKEECPNCSEKLSSESIVPSLIAKKLKGDAKIYCFTRQEALEAVKLSTSSNTGSTNVDADDFDGDNNDHAGGKRKNNRSSSSSSSSSKAASEKKSKRDHCPWIGKVDDA